MIVGAIGQSSGSMSPIARISPAREQVIDLAGAGDAEIGAMILTRDHDDVCEDPAAPVNLAGEMRAMGLMEPED